MPGLGLLLCLLSLLPCLQLQKKIPSVGSVQSTLWMHRLFLSMTLKCPFLWGGLRQVGTFDDMWKESESGYGSSVM